MVNKVIGNVIYQHGIIVITALTEEGEEREFINELDYYLGNNIVVYQKLSIEFINEFIEKFNINLLLINSEEMIKILKIYSIVFK